ncbi:MAG: DUF349 domain-containing protein [Bacteroidetes bacterium]|nr:MAG: DUF349 domain-containing protein [Bacteroidota bacterium]
MDNDNKVVENANDNVSSEERFEKMGEADIIAKESQGIAEEIVEVVNPITEDLTAKVVEETEDLIAQIEDVDQQRAASEKTEEAEEEEDKTDYSVFSKEQLLEEIKTLLDEKSFQKTDAKLRKLKTVIDQLNKDEKELARKAFVEQGGDPDSFEFKQDPITDKFYDQYKALKDRKNKHFADLEGKKSKNLTDKNAILEQIKVLIDGESINKASVDQLKNLQKKWKEIGQVPTQDADNLYQTYKALLDRFYDKKKMEQELVRLDRKKNVEAKSKICDKAEKLLEEDNINVAVEQLNKLHDEYKTIGAVPRDEQEQIWQRFKTASDKLYDRKRKYVEELKKKLSENMKAKQQLCLSIEVYPEFTSDRITEWNIKTKEILALQTEWDKIGAVPREVAKIINKQFWGNFKTFFNNKAKFFELLEASRKDNLKLKEELCQKAEALKDSFDWDASTDLLKEYQEAWKKVGAVPEVDREPIYQRFKAACDFFFNRKRNRRSEQDKEFALNLEKKNAVVEQILALDTTQSTILDDLNTQIEAWQKIGFVPRNNMNEAQDQLIDAVEKLLAKTSLSKDKQEEVSVNLQVKMLNNGGGSPKRLVQKEQNLRKKLTNLENDIALWKNNLEFFANSKTADRLRDEFGKKISDASKQIDSLKAQLKVMQAPKKEETAKA